MSTLIDDFLEQYARERDYYVKVVELARILLESLLEQQGIRAIVTGRAKSLHRLRSKLEARIPEKHYTSFEQMRGDIVDLAGVRVALYFPGDRQRVDKIITDAFAIKELKTFPDQGNTRMDSIWKRRFSGYGATHHRGYLRLDNLETDQQRYTNAQIEIQVASVLMHAWAEVEHDLAYKPLSGQLSSDELSILDEVNGLVVAGEIAFERLQIAAERRIAAGRAPMRSPYEVSSVLIEHARTRLKTELTDTTLGRTDLLLEMLHRLDLDTPEKLQPYLLALDPDFERRPIAEQVVDLVIRGDTHRAALYKSLQTRGSQISDRDLAVGELVRWWTTLEHVIGASIEDDPPSFSRIRQQAQYLLGVNYARFNQLRQLRNEALHRHGGLSVDELRITAASVRRLVELLTDSEDVEVRVAAQQALSANSQ